MRALSERVVDEQHIDANVTTKELENLIAYDEALDLDTEHADVGEWKDRVEDDLLRDIALTDPTIFAECPFLHESLMLEREETLSAAELLEAEVLYEREQRSMSGGGSRFGLYNIPSPSATRPFPPLPPHASYMQPPTQYGYYNYSPQQPMTVRHLLERMNSEGASFNGYPSA